MHVLHPLAAADSLVLNVLQPVLADAMGGIVVAWLARVISVAPHALFPLNEGMEDAALSLPGVDRYAYNSAVLQTALHAADAVTSLLLNPASRVNTALALADSSQVEQLVDACVLLGLPASSNTIRQSHWFLTDVSLLGKSCSARDQRARLRLH